MASARNPHTLEQLTHAHLEAAARAWDPEDKVSDFEMETDRVVTIAGRTFPTKPIVALAHELAGLGMLTNQQLAGAAARRRLEELGFLVSPPDPRTRIAGQALGSDRTQFALERHHVEAGARAMRAEAGDPPNRLISIRPHDTDWRVGIDGLWYNPHRLGHYACAAAGYTYNHMQSGDSNYRRYRAYLESLGFPVKRGRTPVRQPGQTWAEGELRAAAAGLDATGSEEDGGGEDPLQVELDGQTYPAEALLGLPAGTAPSSEDLYAITAAGGSLRVAADPLDAALERLAAREGLPTEVSREIRARIGQGTFRTALLRLHGRCVVSGIAVQAVLRAAHIHRWADCADSERHDPDNGLLLSANLDCLFEAGLIAFADDGRMLVSSKLDPAERQYLQIVDGQRLSFTPTRRQCEYLARHRARTRAARGEDQA